MKNLENIPKKNIFEVPEGYFDKLPGVIQTRVTERDTSPAWRGTWSWSVRYALPILVLAGIGIFWYQTGSDTPVDVDEELGKIQPSQLGMYLEDHDLTTEDLVETVTWSTRDLNDLEKSVYSTYDVSHKEIERILDEYNAEL